MASSKVPIRSETRFWLLTNDVRTGTVWFDQQYRRLASAVRELSTDSFRQLNVHVDIFGLSYRS